MVHDKATLLHATLKTRRNMKTQHMLNFRKLKHDFSPQILKEGKSLYEQGAVSDAKLIALDATILRLTCRIMGVFENFYEADIEINRTESTIVDSNCDCSYKYDCQHIAAALFSLEERYNEILADYSRSHHLFRGGEPQQEHGEEHEQHEHLKKTIEEALCRDVQEQEKKVDKELLAEYTTASQLLGQSPFFRHQPVPVQNSVELALILHLPEAGKLAGPQGVPIQLALRLPQRSKSLSIPSPKQFLDAVQYQEPIALAGKHYCFSKESFDAISQNLIDMLLHRVRQDKQHKGYEISQEDLGDLLFTAFQTLKQHPSCSASFEQINERTLVATHLYYRTIEEPLIFSRTPARLNFAITCLSIPNPKILLEPQVIYQENLAPQPLEEAQIFYSSRPGFFKEKTYYFFSETIRRTHLQHLPQLRNTTIPEPLFGTLIENAIPELARYGTLSHSDTLEQFVTIPSVEHLRGECDIAYLNGELEARLYFIYDNQRIPAAAVEIHKHHLNVFCSSKGVLARHLTEEQRICENLFADFVHDPAEGVYFTKSEKALVSFMTEKIPHYQHQIQFHCPPNLLEQFLYDDSVFELNLRETQRIDAYQVEIKVSGHLSGVTVDALWDCFASHRPFIELTKKRTSRKKGDDQKLPHKILILDLEKLAPVIYLLDEIGIKTLDHHTEERPLWSLVNFDAEKFAHLPIRFSISSRLLEIQQQMLGSAPDTPFEIPPLIQASLRNYQVDGARWLQRLRTMHLNGILADDMGLGKTLQTIVALTQYHLEHPGRISIVVCPTSLLYNWKEELNKFAPHFRVLVVDGNPNHRKRLLCSTPDHHIIVTSYTLLQKDVEVYQQTSFGYIILDEAQHIKNRGTRNAQSVKLLIGAHRLVLTGTPIENSLDELWSLFDFLMPGLLSSYDRFTEKYLRGPHTIKQQACCSTLGDLKKKLSPFILRRMKKDVLTDLPPLSEIVYHCHLSETQQALYRSYAASAREELSQLVHKKGFDRVQIHILATLTRLKQICCHPAIFAKERAEPGDSTKYDMLLELLDNLRQGGHKIVVFSQYTKMLNILREDLIKQGLQFAYLDGSTKNRLDIVNKFNEDENIPIFLVSLKAGGTGLNLVGADTVIHYDMWWNPAVQKQALDRVYRLKQKKKHVYCYQIIARHTIEEKILELHRRKQGLVTEVIREEDEHQEDDILSKLTWEEVLELLQT